VWTDRTGKRSGSSACWVRCDSHRAAFRRREKSWFAVTNSAMLERVAARHRAWVTSRSPRLAFREVHLGPRRADRLSVDSTALYQKPTGGVGDETHYCTGVSSTSVAGLVARRKTLVYGGACGRVVSTYVLPMELTAAKRNLVHIFRRGSMRAARSSRLMGDGCVRLGRIRAAADLHPGDSCGGAKCRFRRRVVKPRWRRDVRAVLCLCRSKADGVR